METVFPSNRTVLLNEFSIPANRNRLCVQLKQYYFIQRFFFCLLKPGDAIFEKQPFCASGKGISGQQKPFFSSILRHSCYCQLYFSVQWISIFKRIPVSRNGFSGQWEHFFLKLFFNISASGLCRYQTFMPVFFASSGNVILKRILLSGQWKRIFWLAETILFQYLKYAFHWKQFFHLLEIYFKRILYYRRSQRNFCSVETIFFHPDFFGNHYCNQTDANIFLKNLISDRKNLFLQLFFRY